MEPKLFESHQTHFHWVVWKWFDHPIGLRGHGLHAQYIWLQLGHLDMMHLPGTYCFSWIARAWFACRMRMTSVGFIGHDVLAQYILPQLDWLETICLSSTYDFNSIAWTWRACPIHPAPTGLVGHGLLTWYTLPQSDSFGHHVLSQHIWLFVYAQTPKQDYWHVLSKWPYDNWSGGLGD